MYCDNRGSGYAFQIVQLLLHATIFVLSYRHKFSRLVNLLAHIRGAKSVCVNTVLIHSLLFSKSPKDSIIFSLFFREFISEKFTISPGDLTAALNLICESGDIIF